jgi:WD40 repeat protein
MKERLIITVHGIRTFGQWQERLESLVTDDPKGQGIEFANYKYGYFSVVAFIIPFFRWLVVRQFRKEMISLCDSKLWSRIDLVGHSFGTHIIGWAVSGLPSESKISVHTIILSGSVLRSGFPWHNLLNKRVKRLVNDCGTKDAVLLLSQFLVLFTGMAGRTGFGGATSAAFRNRYSEFGHSGYFQDSRGKPSNQYMEANWVPLLITDGPIALFDERKGGAFEGIVQVLANNAEPIKITIYIVPFILLTWWILGLYLDADRQRLLAESRGLRAEARRLIDQGSPNQALILLRAASRPETTNEVQDEAAREGLFDLAHGQVTAILPEFQFAGSEQIVFSPSGDSLITGSQEARQWHLPSGALGAILKARASETSFNRAVACSADDSRIATGGQNGAALWDSQTGGLIAALTEENTADVAFSPDSRLLLSADQSGEVRLFDSQNGNLLAVLEQQSYNSFFSGSAKFAFSPDGRRLITTGSSAGAHLWDTKAIELVATLPGVTLVSKSSFSRDGSRLVADGGLWDGESGKLIEKLDEGGIELSVSFSQDQTYFLTGSWNRLSAWRADTGDLIKILVPKTDRILTIAFSPDGARFVAGGADSLELWDARTFEVITTLVGHSDFVQESEFSPDSRTLVTVSSDSVRMWEAGTGLLEATLRSKEGPSKEGTFDVARFSPDGKRLAVGGFQSPAQLLNLDRLPPVRRVCQKPQSLKQQVYRETAIFCGK